MSNKLYKGPQPPKKDYSMLLMWCWCLLMGGIIMAAIYKVASSIPDYSDMDMPYPTATSSVATWSNADSPDIAVGFLTLDGKGIASNPFMTESEIDVIWGDTLPESFSALPLLIYGTASEDKKQLTVSEWYKFPYEYGTTGAADAYYTCIESGWQEGFEELWTEVYAKLNGEEECTQINPVILQEILEGVYQKEEFGDLRDIVTDCLVLVNDININGPSEEYNEQAANLYNLFYSWLCNFSVDMLKSESG